MAKVGIHGIIIPRDARLLRRLYWKENHTLPEIAAMYGVNHKSVENVFRELGIPWRGVGSSRHQKCIECGKPVYKIKHAGNGAMYGKRCKKHWNEHRARLAKQAALAPAVRDRKHREHHRWYYYGPLNPEGESQWISKGRAILRRAKRAIRAVSQSQKRASEPERNSQD